MSANGEQQAAAGKAASTRGFGRGRKLGIALQVGLTLILGVAIFVLLNWLATRPTLRKSFDWTRTARFTISDETKALIESVRASGKKLEIRTFFQDPKDIAMQAQRSGEQASVQALARIQARCMELTRDLLRRLAYLGGDAIEVRHEDIYGASFGGRARAESLDGSIINSIQLRVGDRKRGVDLLRDLADVEFPQAQAQRPGSLTIPVLRAYRGESVLAGALQALLQEKGLIAYFVTSDLASHPQDVRGSGVSGLARALTARGFRNKLLAFDTATEIPEDCRLLILVGPQRIARKQVTAIQSYVRRGGRVLVTLHAPMHLATDVAVPSYRRFLEAFGLRMGSSWLWNGVPDGADAERYRFGSPECARIVVKNGLSGKHPVSARLRQLDLPVVLHRARPLEIQSSMPEGMRAQYFLSTNPRAYDNELPRGDLAPSLAYPDKKDTSTRHVGVVVDVPIEGKSPGRLVLISGMVFQNGGDPFLARTGGAERLIQVNERLATLLADWLVREKGEVSVAPSQYRPATMDVSLPQIERAEFWLVRILPLAFLVLALFVLFWRRRA